MNTRYSMIFSGPLRDAGFTATTKFIAFQYRVKGIARNIGNGRVEVVAEGKDAILADFFAALKHQFGKNITKVELRQAPATGEFAGFHVEL